MPSDNNFSKSFKDTLKRLNMLDDNDDNDDNYNMTDIVSNNSQNMAKYSSTYVPPNDDIATTSNATTRTSSIYANNDDNDNDNDNYVDNDVDDSGRMIQQSITQQPQRTQQSQQSQYQIQSSSNNGRRQRNGDFDEDEIRRAIEASIQDYENVMTKNSNIAKEQAKLMFEASKKGITHEIPETLYNNEHLIEEIFRTFEKMQENEVNTSIIAKQNEEYDESEFIDTYNQQQIQYSIGYDKEEDDESETIDTHDQQQVQYSIGYDEEDDEILHDILEKSKADRIILNSSLPIVNAINQQTNQEQQQQSYQPIILTREELAAKRLAALTKNS